MIKQKHFYLIRGLVREARHWDDFPEHLLRLFPEAKITTIDIPGMGEYYASPTPLSIKGMTEVMHRKFRTSRTENEESILVAISLGGMIASVWLKEHPEDFHHAFLINTSFGGFSPVFHRLKPEALLYLLRTPLVKDQKEAHILKLVSNNPARHERTLLLWNRIHQEKPVKRSTAIRQLFAAAAYRAHGEAPMTPVYLLGSTNDRMVNIDCSRAISRSWKVPLIEHPHGGHDLTTDYPEWVVEQIRSFLAKA